MIKRWNVFIICFVLMSAILLTTGCSKGTTSKTTETVNANSIAKSGDTVKVEYTGKLSDGTIFDSSVGKDPLEFTLGNNQVIVGFEKAVTGMKVGESKTVTIPAAEAYGQYRNDLVFVMDRSNFPAEQEPKVGMRFQGTNQAGTLLYTIIEVNETTVKVDGNHALAGKDLTFEIKLVEIKSK
jgi:peptidylprolyl isomerase